MNDVQSVADKRRWLKEMIAQRNVAVPQPMSYQQKSLWFMHMLEPDSPAYNVLYVAVLRSGVDVGLLRKAVQLVVQRHGILRTAYGQDDNEPWQCVTEHSSVYTEVVDVQGWSEEAVQRYVEDEADRRFALEDGENIRVRVIRNVISYRGKENVDLFQIVVHHIAIDFWSLELLMEEICAAYESGGLSPVDGDQTTSSTYAQFVTAQQHLLAGEKGKLLESYWLDKLRDLAPSYELPTDFGREDTPSHAGTATTFGFCEELTRKVTEQAKVLGVTPYSMCLSAFYILLHKYTGRRDLIIGTPTIGRALTNARDCLGYYANPVPLRVMLADGDNGSAFVKKVYRTLIEALDHQDYPFALLVDKLGVKRDPAVSPIFQLSFVWDQSRQLSNDGLSVIDTNILVSKPLHHEQRGSASDLTLTVFNKGGPMVGMVKYNTALYKAETVERLIGHYRQILSAIVADSERRIAYLNYLMPEEVHTGRGAADVPGISDGVGSNHETVVGLFEHYAETAPSLPAVSSAGVSLNYAELRTQVDRMIRMLRSAGVMACEPVGVLLARSVDLYVAFLACLKSGAVYVPLDPSYPDERLEYMVRQSGVRAVLTSNALREKIGNVEHVCIDAKKPVGSDPQGALAPVRLHPRQPAYMMFTSGSTGMPKGVLLEHGGLMNLTRFQRAAYEVDSSSRILQFAPMGFDLSVADFVLALGAGASMVILSDAERRSADSITDTINAKGVTHVQLPASILGVLLQVSTPSLKVIVIGGDVSSEDVLGYWKSNARVINAYGPTESTVTVTFNPDLRTDDVANIGGPIPGMLVRLLDDELMPLPDGRLGEIFLGGAGLAIGYVDNPRLTAERFVPDPYAETPGARLYRTGDTARRMADGDVRYVGRKDAQLHLRGYRIEPGEIEAVLRQHPNVSEAVVCAMKDIQGAERLVAFYRQETAAAVNGAAMRKFALRLLPEHMVPAKFVAVERLQLNNNGKIDRRSLPNPFTDEEKSPIATQQPADQIEEKILGIWRTVLGVDSLSVTDNFFESGGDSILAIQIAGKLSRAGIEASTQLIYRHQSVREFRRHYTLVEEAPLKSEVRLDDNVRLSPIQHWFLARPMSNRNHFDQFLIVNIEVNVNAGLLQTAIEQTVAAHSIFRLRCTADGTVSMAADASQAVSFQVMDLAGFPADSIDADIDKLMNALHTSQDLENGPVMHAALINGNGVEDARLALVAHHLYVDAVSWRVLIDDISDLYSRSLESAVTDELPAETAFFEWTDRLSRSIAPARLDERARHWLHQQEHAGVDLHDARGIAPQGESEILEISLDESASASLTRLANENYNASMEELVTTAYLSSLSKQYGNGGTLLNIETHGRDLFADIDLKRAVGWFTNQFPVKFPQPADGSTQAYIGVVKETLRHAKADGHEFGVLQYMSGVDLRNQFDVLPMPFASLNYLGRMDGGLRQSPFKGISTGGFGASMCPMFEHPQRLALDAFILDECLTLSIRFNAQFDSQERVHSLAQDTMTILTTMANGIGEEVVYSPSDFPDADLSSDELDKILEQIS